MPSELTIDDVLALRDRLPDPAERRAIRERLGLSRAVVARELGVSEDIVYRWEHGRAEPRVANLGPYVDLLDRLRDRADRDGTDAA